MARLRNLLRQPLWQAWLFGSLVLLFYFLLGRPSDPVEDLLLHKDFAYLVLGDTGVAVLQLPDGQKPVEVQLYDTFGTARAVAIQENRILIADSKDGLLVRNLSDGLIDDEGPNVRSYQPSGEITDMVVFGKEYVVALTDNKDAELQVIRVPSNPNDKFNAQRLDIVNDPTHVEIYDNRVFVSNENGILYIYQLAGFNQPELISELNTESAINQIEVTADRVYAATETRGLLVIDFSDSQNPQIIGAFSEDPEKEEQADQSLHLTDVAVRGNYAYLLRSEGRIMIADISNLDTIREVPHQKSLRQPNHGEHIAILDTQIYVADGLDGLRAYDALIDFDVALSTDISAQGLFEDVVVYEDKYAYIAMGARGLRVLNIEDPNAPIELPFEFIPEDSYAVKVELEEDVLYVGYRGEGIIPFNLDENPENPSNNIYETLGSEEVNDFKIVGSNLYVAAGESGLHIYDIEMLWAPRRYPTVDFAGTANGIFVLDDYAYIASGGSGLRIFDVADADNVVEISQFLQENGDSRAVFVVKEEGEGDNPDQVIAYLADGPNGLSILDVSDPLQPILLGKYETDASVATVLVRSEIAYVADTEAGLVLLDVSQPSNPQRLGSFDTDGNPSGLFLTETRIFIADEERGLKIVSVEEPGEPAFVGLYDRPKRTNELLLHETTGYITDHQGYFWVFDIFEDPSQPITKRRYQTPGMALDLAFEQPRLYVADGPQGLTIYDTADLTTPAGSYTFSPQEDARLVQARNQRAYLISGDTQFRILDTSDLENITITGVFEARSRVTDIALVGNYAYLAEPGDGIQIIPLPDDDGEAVDDAQQEQANQQIEEVQDDEDLELTAIRIVRPTGVLDPHRFARMGNQPFLFVADGSNGLVVLEIKNNRQPRQIERIAPISAITDVFVQQDFALVVDHLNTVRIFYIHDPYNLVEVGRYPQSAAEGDIPPNIIALAASVQPPLKRELKPIYIYYTTSEQGLRTLTARGEMVVKFLGIYETPGEASWGQIFRRITDGLTFLVYRSFGRTPAPVETLDKVLDRLNYMAYGTVLFLMLGFFWLLVLSFFILPIFRLRDWLQVFKGLRIYLWNRHGPAITVKEGQIVKRSGELQRSGWGVARIDINSALVIEFCPRQQGPLGHFTRRFQRRAQRQKREIPKVRVEGPGVVFMNPCEVIRSAADLRVQFRIRLGVKALTRDGIEIYNPVWIIFTLGQAPEVLQVAYQGGRQAENLRVVALDTTYVEDPDDPDQTIYATVVRSLTDELEADDKLEIHRYVQQWRQEQFARKTRALAAHIELTTNGIQDFLARLNILVTNYTTSTPQLEQRIANVAAEEQLAGRVLGASLRGGLHAAFWNWLQGLSKRVSGESFDFRARLYQQMMADICAWQQIPIGARQENLRLLATIFADVANQPDLLPYHRSIQETRAHSRLPVAQQLVSPYPIIERYRKLAKQHWHWIQVDQRLRLDGPERSFEWAGVLRMLWLRQQMHRSQRIADRVIRRGRREFERYLEFAALDRFRQEIQRAYHEMQSHPDELLPVEELSKQQLDERTQRTAELVAHIQDAVQRLDRAPAAPLSGLVRRIQRQSKRLPSHDRLAVSAFIDRLNRDYDRMVNLDNRAIAGYLRMQSRQLARLQRAVARAERLVDHPKLLARQEAQHYQAILEQLQPLLKALQGKSQPAQQADKPVRNQTSPYLFDAERVFAAIYSEALDIGEDQLMPWTDLPAHAAAREYRDALATQKYDYLYEESGASKLNLQVLKTNFHKTVRNLGVLAFQYVEQADGGYLQEKDSLPPEQVIRASVKALETPKVLRRRGVKVIRAGFPDLNPASPELRRYQLDHWRARWQREESDIRTSAELQASRVISRARAQAQREMAYTLARILESNRSQEALAMRVFQALEQAATDPGTQQFLPRDTILMMRSFKRWFLPEGDEPDDESDFFALGE